MAFKALNQVIGSLENHAGLQQSQEFQSLLRCWPEVVGAAVMAQTRPLAIDRGVLKVATSSAVWAQQLMFQRRQILAKLNLRLPASLVDIRFSTAQWHNPLNDGPATQEQTVLWREHPSRVVDTPTGDKIEPKPAVKEPKEAFQQWAEGIQARTQSLPLCEQCQCPAPPGELQRWGVCALCATRGW
ncbi:DUF721 domain-containing protein [Microcoleus sp. FACHB-672]|uniref:DUF721 domain-containing protein n=1 Tax=Microcoleus sp. FACHB-672 TaxID=2692825 RepID=UPI001686969F|nr:DciA family protein [Microcoleus sp. FACHB-672]MBD2040696.1 DUF721 domain-containing protein [Microcoleus sp. FACHB-672]